MITVRRAKDRFHTRAGWLDSWHTFSFGEHFDSSWLGFHRLRVINDDTVQPGQGFGAHGHREMEIVSYVLEGALQHKDSSGGGGVIRPGDVQRMSAGTGVVHSEFNASAEEPVHFLQIWVEPAEKGIPAGYEQKSFPLEERKGRLCLLVSPDGQQGSVRVHQDASLHGALLDSGQRASFVLDPARSAWVHIARGQALVNGQKLQAGDGAAITDQREVNLEGLEAAELLLFDLP